MDRASWIGLFLGLGAVLLGNALEGGRVGSLLQLTAAVIVFGGTTGAVLLSYSARQVGAAVRALGLVFTRQRLDLTGLIENLVRLSFKARKDGIVSLEPEVARQDDPFLARALALAVDGVDSRLLRETMEIEIDNLEAELDAPARVWETAGAIAPTIGILGAVLGLIHVMENLTDPSKLGAGIAVAFVATVYGVGSANLVFFPVCYRIRGRVKDRVRFHEAALEGILAIQNGDNPRMIEEKLKGYLSRQEQAAFASVATRLRRDGGE